MTEDIQAISGNSFYIGDQPKTIKMSYSEKLRDPRWQKKRLEILQRDNFTCTLCGDTSTPLNIHHLKYEGNPWEVSSEFLKTVCEDCHRLIEDRKRGNLPELYKVIKFPKQKGLQFFIASSGKDPIEIFSYTDNELNNFLFIAGNLLDQYIKDLKPQ